MKKHLKELESLRKRQQKERNLVQKSQCGAIEKIVKNKGRYVSNKFGKEFYRTRSYWLTS